MTFGLELHSKHAHDFNEERYISHFQRKYLKGSTRSPGIGLGRISPAALRTFVTTTNKDACSVLLKDMILEGWFNGVEIMLQARKLDINQPIPITMTDGKIERLTPLQIAIMYNAKVEIVEKLLRHPGVKVDGNSNDTIGNLLTLAIRSDNAEAMEVLLKSDAIKGMIHQPFRFRLYNEHKKATPLQFAIHERKDKIVSLLLEQPGMPTNVNPGETNFPSPLEMVDRLSREVGGEPVVAVFRKKGLIR